MVAAQHIRKRRRGQRSNQNQSRRGNRAGEQTRQTKNNQPSTHKPSDNAHNNKPEKETANDVNSTTQEHIENNVVAITPPQKKPSIESQQPTQNSTATPTEKKSVEHLDTEINHSPLEKNSGASLHQVQTSKRGSDKTSPKMEVKSKTGHVTFNENEKTALDNPSATDMQQVKTKKSDNS